MERKHSNVLKIVSILHEGTNPVSLPITHSVFKVLKNLKMHIKILLELNIYKNQIQMNWNSLLQIHCKSNWFKLLEQKTIVIFGKCFTTLFGLQSPTLS